MASFNQSAITKKFATEIIPEHGVTRGKFSYETKTKSKNVYVYMCLPVSLSLFICLCELAGRQHCPARLGRK